MTNKNVKVVDEHNIDRDANVLFAFDLEGSEYVSYWIERDESQDNIFVSKVTKNIDNTFNLFDVDDMEKEKISETVKSLIMTAVNSQEDKLVGESVTLSDGKNVKFITVSFNKEQKINVKKSYVTTVNKKVTKVAGDYYDVVSFEAPKVAQEDIFPAVTPVQPAVVEEPVPVLPELGVPSVSQPAELKTEDSVMAQVVAAPVAPTAPVVNEVKSAPVDEFVAFGSETAEKPAVAPVAEPAPVKEVVPPVAPQPAVVEAITNTQPTTEPTLVQSVPQTAPVVSVVEEQVVQPAPVEAVVVPTPVAPATPVVAPAASVVTAADTASQPLVFNASKETNLNAALGEVANSTTIPVENIEPVREFGVEEPVKETAVPVQQPSATPTAKPVATKTDAVTGKAGFANHKFFMVVAVAFFLASCIFLGYEVFNYFQLTK